VDGREFCWQRPFVLSTAALAVLYSGAELAAQLAQPSEQYLCHV
jgi:hypothetical protein